jgi:hypothetical protein
MLLAYTMGGTVFGSVVMEVGPFSGNGFSASFLHGASNAHSGGFYMNGGLSGSLTGDLDGDLVGDILTLTGGTLTGSSGVFGAGNLNILIDGGTLDLDMGPSAGKTLVGGFLSYSDITANGSSIVGSQAGNLYFHPTGFTGGGTGPNTYESGGDGVLLWGNNWQNTQADWTGVPLPANPITAANRAGAAAALGNSQPLGFDGAGSIEPGGGVVPEPASVLVWSLIMTVWTMLFGRSRRYG